MRINIRRERGVDNNRKDPDPGVRHEGNYILLGTAVTYKELLERGYTLKDFYALIPPFAYAAIYVNERTGDRLYYVIEPPLTEKEYEALKLVKEMLSSELGAETLYARVSEKELEDLLKERFRKVVLEYGIDLPVYSFGKLFYYIKRDFIGYGKLEPLFHDPYIEDIMCNGVNVPIFIWHVMYESLRTNIVFESVDELNTYVSRIAYKAKKHVSIAEPLVDGILPDGSRVNIALSEVAKRGHAITIRKFVVKKLSIVDLIIQGTISPEVAAYLWLAVDYGMSIMIIGGTGAGKTTLLNAIANLIPPDKRIVTIEDIPEIKLMHENWVQLITRPATEGAAREITLMDLLKNSLRMRPDYIIVGEVRGEETYVLFQALATGHAGMATMHAESVDYAIKRLISRPMNIPPILVPLVRVFVVISRVRKREGAPGGGGKIVRRVTAIHEMLDYDTRTNTFVQQQVYKWDFTRDTHVKVAKESYLFRLIEETRFVSLNEIKEDFNRRVIIMRALAEQKITDFDTVNKIVKAYRVAPTMVYSKALARRLP